MSFIFENLFGNQNSSDDFFLQEDFNLSSINSSNTLGEISSQQFGSFQKPSDEDESQLSLSPQSNLNSLRDDNKRTRQNYLKSAKILISVLQKALKTEKNKSITCKYDDIRFLEKNFSCPKITYFDPYQDIISSAQQNGQKQFICNFCNKQFKQPCQLGGHISKNHPNQSKQYQKRIKKYEDNRIDKIRKLYLFKHLSGNLIRKSKTF